MARKSNPPKQASGGARLKASGRHPLLLGLTAEQLDIVRQVAALESRPMTQVVIRHALASMEKSLKKGKISS